MPRIVCENCEREYTGEKIGVNVIDIATGGDGFDPYPYRITSADRYRCTICRHVILCGFADQPTYHHEKRFSERLRRVLKSGNYVLSYERHSDKRAFLMRINEYMEGGNNA